MKIIKQKYKLQLGVKLTKQLTNETVSSLQSRVGKLESQVCLLEDALINNEIKTNKADQYSRLNNIVIQGIP